MQLKTISYWYPTWKCWVCYNVDEDNNQVGECRYYPNRKQMMKFEKF